jgi:hypothetical protein
LQEVGGERQPAHRRSSSEAQEVEEMPDGNPRGGLAVAVRAGGRGGAHGRHGVRLVERQGRGAVVLVLVPVRWRTTDGKYGGEVTGDDDEEDTAGLVRRRKAPRDLGLELGKR